MEIDYTHPSVTVFSFDIIFLAICDGSLIYFTGTIATLTITLILANIISNNQELSSTGK